MSDTMKIGFTTLVLLSDFWLSKDSYAASSNFREFKPKVESYIEGPSIDRVAASIKSKTAQPNQSLKPGSLSAEKIGKYDTILIDSLDGKKFYFRKYREKITDQFVDSTDIAIEGITENDSLFFNYSDTAGTKDFKVFKVPSKFKNTYVLHFQYSPSNPPTGQAFSIIGHVDGVLKIIPPKPFTFAGSLSGFSSEKISNSNDGFSVSIWNGNFGIEVPIEIHAQRDSTYLTVSKSKSIKIQNSKAYHFNVTKQPGKAFYKENEDVNLYSDIYKKKVIKVKTPKIEEIVVKGVWVKVESNSKQPGIQDFIDACSESSNSLLEVKVGNKKGYIEYQDYNKIGYQDAG